MAEVPPATNPGVPPNDRSNLVKAAAFFVIAIVALVAIKMLLGW